MILIVPCHHDVVGKSSSHAHTFLLINKKTVLLYFYIFFKLCFHCIQLTKSFFRLFKFCLKTSDTLFKFSNFFQKLAVWGVVASFNFGPLFSWLHFRFQLMSKLFVYYPVLSFPNVVIISEKGN